MSVDLAGTLLFLSVYLAATLSPGPAAAAVVARVLGTGLRRTAPFIWGVVVGDLVWFGLVALGLSTLAQSFHALFLVIKYAGVAYLLFLAWTLWTAPAKPPVAAPDGGGEGVRLFLGGLALTLGNPKVMVFFVSILPLVVDLVSITPLIFLEVSAMIVAVLSFAMWSYALAAERARRLISNPLAMRAVNKGTGAVMAGVAMVVALRG